eukprot:Selendium_serpulae@DN5573_c0_g1_i2.p1
MEDDLFEQLVRAADSKTVPRNSESDECFHLDLDQHPYSTSYKHRSSSDEGLSLKQEALLLTGQVPPFPSAVRGTTSPGSLRTHPQNVVTSNAANERYASDIASRETTSNPFDPRVSISKPLVEKSGDYRRDRSSPRSPVSSEFVAPPSDISTDPERAHLMAHGVDSDSFGQLHHHVPSPSLTSEDDGCLTYFLQMIRNLREPLHIRGKQGRVTLWEITEHFDMVNDLVFLYRVACTIALVGTPEAEDTSQSWFYSPFSAFWGNPESVTAQHPTDSSKKLEVGLVVFYWLCAIWVTSVAAYAVRSLTIYHRITQEHMGLFAPFAVFWKIRQVGDKSPENLYMFERLSWTYQVMMRIIEDIPQFVLSSVFSATYGADVYSGFMISWSAVLMILTSYRMGVMYPIVGTASLLVSRQPPVDSPHLNEAAHVTRGFAAFMIFVTVLWSCANVASLKTATGMVFLWAVGTQVVLFLIGLTSACYYRHLVRQASLSLEFGESLQPNSPSCDERHETYDLGNSSGAVELVQKLDLPTTHDRGSPEDGLREAGRDSIGTRDQPMTIALSTDSDSDCHSVRDEFTSTWRGPSIDRGIEYQKISPKN